MVAILPIMTILILTLRLSCSYIKGGVDAKELFHFYITLWIQDKRLALLELCKLDRVRFLIILISIFIAYLHHPVSYLINKLDAYIALISEI